MKKLIIQMMVITTVSITSSAQIINESILDIDFKNPSLQKANIKNFPLNNWPKIVCGNSTWLPGSSPKEWSSILDDKNFNDNNEIVGVFGIVVTKPHVSHEDVWFTHPFGFDWNFDVGWKSNTNFNSLQSPQGITEKDSEAADARKAAISKGMQGVIHVEMDSGFIPPFYRAKKGNSVAVFGRWIVDCGHDNFQTEIHPPLMFVKAVGQAAIGGGSFTESTVIGRPFMITQTFGKGKSLRNHIAEQTIKLLGLQTTGPFAAAFKYEAIPIILPNSFSGSHLMTFNIRPPRKALQNEHLYLSYHFTVRTGVTVTFFDVNDGYGTIRVNVLFDELNYTPPTIPLVVEETIPIETIKKFNSDLSKALWVGQFGAAANPFVAIALQKGVTTKRYNIPLYTEQNDIKVSMNELRANNQAGIVVDNTQIYPIRGSMKVEWIYKEPEFVADLCKLHPSQLNTDKNEIVFFPNNLNKSQLITIANPTNTPIQLGKLFLDGENPERFVLQSKTIISTRPGGSQPPEECSNILLQPHGSCSFRVAMLPGSSGNLLHATINIPGGGPCPLKITIRELNKVQ